MRGLPSLFYALHTLILDNVQLVISHVVDIEHMHHKLSLHQIQPTVKINLLPNAREKIFTPLSKLFLHVIIVFINCIKMCQVNVTSTHYNIKFIQVNTSWRHVSSSPISLLYYYKLIFICLFVCFVLQVL